MDCALASNIVDLVTAPDDLASGPELARFSLRDWERSMFWLDASGLALLLEQRIRQRRLQEFVPAPVIDRLRSAAGKNRQRTQVMLAEFHRVVSALHQEGIVLAVLKGFSLVPDYCSDPNLRLQVDFDFLVRAEQLARVAAVMNSLGYGTVSRLPFEIRFSTGKTAPRQHSELYMPPDNFVAEFHFALIDRPEFSACLGNDALERRCWREAGGVRFPALASDDQFIHHTLHAFQDVFLFSLRISSLVETANLLRAKGSCNVFWRDVQQRCAHAGSGIPPKLALVLALSTELCRTQIPASLGGWTVGRASPRILFWVRRYGRKWCLRPFPGSKLSLLVSSEFMERGTWSRYVRTSVAPFDRIITSRKQRRVAPRYAPWHYLVQRAWFHVREAVLLLLELPGWALARRDLS
jgi:Uncharacterised nucleotidyltransferase